MRFSGLMFIKMMPIESSFEHGLKGKVEIANGEIIARNSCFELGGSRARGGSSMINETDPVVDSR